MLNGYKTYIIAVCIGLVAAAHFLGWIDGNLTTTVLTLLGAGAVASTRAAIAKS